ncbi:Acetyl esterase/lipase [Algoriphagus aquimarinus]|uniref:Acetyl esterase/lipase n=2 Tax=Algoriphagus aquimarinus TaxID=237018 RepID=A0A1I1BL76_9BACT|nr:Acetyl esterase/lipase [Algoriphagus aquimarinus]
MVLNMYKNTMKLFWKSCLYIIAIYTLSSCISDKDENPTENLAALDLFDQSYGAEQNQIFDIYLPAGRSIAKTPLLIYIHGGAWVEGSKEEFNQFRQALSREFTEYAFASINYRLYNFSQGNNKFPAQEDDVLEALSYFQSKASEWNISDKLILAGASAGGHLALLHAYKHPTVGNVRAVIAFFPPTNLAELYDFSFFTQTGLSGMLGGNPKDKPEAFAASSPITFINSKSVPTIFFHGTSDIIVPISQSQLLKKALIDAGVKYEFTEVPNQGHGFTLDTYPSLFQQAAKFVKEQM